MSIEGKYSDIFTGPRQDLDTGWDKPMVFDDRSLPSGDDAARFNVPQGVDAVKEARAKAAVKAAKTRAAYGGAPSLDDTTPPWVERGAEAPEEWSPSPRPWWKKILLTVAVFACSIGFVFAVVKPIVGESALNSAQSGEASQSGEPNTPPPLMTTPVADGTMKFQVLAVTPQSELVSPGTGLAAAEADLLLVEMKVTNADTAPADFDPLAQRIITHTGRQYGPRIEEQRAISGPDMVTRIEPGGDTQARMAFDIPAGEVPVMLFLHSKAGSYGTTVRFN